jgi:exopolysaccharide/PEP-CTERM locus tyrosine autokinase
MTAHRPIRVPSEPSLLERAASHFDLAAVLAPGMPAPQPLEPMQAASVPRWAGEPQAIDRDRLRAQGFIVPGDPVTALLEEMRLVKRQLVLAAAESRAGLRGPRGERILVASAQPGEGKTWIAVNLALAIAAEMDNEVLLVDADFAKPSVLSTLGLAAGPGLMDAIADPSLRVEEAVIATDVPGLAVLPAGRATVSDTEYLASAQTAEVLDRLSVQAPSRLIIFDSPPVLAASPAAELAAHVGQTLLVVRADRTAEAEVADALSLLSACEDRKLILNGVQFSPTGRRFGAYYGYPE